MWSGGTALKDGVILYTLNNQRDTTIKPYLFKIVTIAGYKASFRVQSEWSERLRELHEVQGSRELAPWRDPGRAARAGLGRGCPVDTSQPQAEKRRPSRQARPGSPTPAAGIEYPEHTQHMD